MPLACRHPDWGPAPGLHCTCARQMAPPYTKYRPHTQQTENSGYRRDVGVKRWTGPTWVLVATGRAAESWIEQRFACRASTSQSCRCGHTGELEGGRRQLTGHDRGPGTRAQGYAKSSRASSCCCCCCSLKRNGVSLSRRVSCTSSDASIVWTR